MINLFKITNSFYIFRKTFWQKAKDDFLEIISYFFIKVYLGILFGINLLIWILSEYIFQTIGSEQIALHANIDFGIDYYGSAKEIFILPLLGLLVVALNFSLAASFSRHRDRIFLFHLLLASGILINLILLAAIISVYYINFK